MPRVKKGRKNAKSSKKQAKCKTRKRAEIKLPAPMVNVKVKFDPDDQTFTYCDAEKVAEADNDACGHKVMSVSEYVRSVRPELVRDIKPKIEPVIKEEPLDENPDPDPEIDASISIDDEGTNDEILNNPTRERQPNKKSTKCSICHKSFKDRNGLRRHKYVHKEKTLKCDICDKLFSIKSKLNDHKQIHLPNRKMYPCDICQKEFLTKHGLRNHQSIHDTKRKLFECRICEKKFTLDHNLKWHIQHIHVNNEKLKCIFCEKDFARKYNLSTHMRFEHFALLRQQDKGTGDLHELFKGIRTYECYRCKYSTKNIVRVKKHMEKCEGIRSPVKCDLCNNRFKNIFSLKKHMRQIHSIYKGKWEREQMLEEAGKTFECIDCQASFIKKDGLTKHIKLNCNKRVFRCDYCSVKFPRQTDKEDHHRRVHPILLRNSHDQKYKCHICKVSILARRAIRHLATKHQIKTVFKLNICRLKSPE